MPWKYCLWLTLGIIKRYITNKLNDARTILQEKYWDVGRNNFCPKHNSVTIIRLKMSPDIADSYSTIWQTGSRVARSLVHELRIHLYSSKRSQRNFLGYRLLRDQGSRCPSGRRSLRSDSAGNNRVRAWWPLTTRCTGGGSRFGRESLVLRHLWNLFVGKSWPVSCHGTTFWTAYTQAISQRLVEWEGWGNS